LSAQRQILLLLPAGEQAVVADALKTRGKRMEHEPANELVTGDRHTTGFLFVSGTVILVLKGNLTILESKNPLIGNGNAVSVPAKVFQHLKRTTEGRLGIDNPFNFLERFHQQVKSGRILKPGDDSRKLELVVVKSQLEGLY
jgi:hypothetical protein